MPATTRTLGKKPVAKAAAAGGPARKNTKRSAADDDNGEAKKPAAKKAKQAASGDTEGDKKVKSSRPARRKARGKHADNNSDDVDPALEEGCKRSLRVEVTSAAPIDADTLVEVITFDIPAIYLQVLPDNADGVHFLFSAQFYDALEPPAKSIAKMTNNVGGEQVLEEFRRLLLIKAFVCDADAKKISPTALMDALWHAAILDTQFYKDLQAAMGLELHHRPSGAGIGKEETRARGQRLAIMKAIYTNFFSSLPIGYLEPSLTDVSSYQVFVKGLTGKTITLEVHLDSTGQDILDGIWGAGSFHEGRTSSRLIFGGKQLDLIRPLRFYGIAREATIHHILRGAGC